jgi:hypothetical protein
MLRESLNFFKKILKGWIFSIDGERLRSVWAAESVSCLKHDCQYIQRESGIPLLYPYPLLFTIFNYAPDLPPNLDGAEV